MEKKYFHEYVLRDGEPREAKECYERGAKYDLARTLIDEIGLDTEAVVKVTRRESREEKLTEFGLRGTRVRFEMRIKTTEPVY